MAADSFWSWSMRQRYSAKIRSSSWVNLRAIAFFSLTLTAQYFRSLAFTAARLLW
jgi:hypothetical protein